MNKENQSEGGVVMPQPYIFPAMYQERQDELSTKDIWLMLVKYKKVISGIAIFCIALGIAYVLLSPKIYSYTATIQLGTKFVGEQEVVIDRPTNVL